MSDAMVQHVSGVTGALDDASGQVAQVGACVMRTRQQIQSAVSALFGDMMSAGGNAGSFAGPAASAAASAIEPLSNQMDECARAAGQVSTALSICSSRIVTAARMADHAGLGVEVLAWIVDALDLGEVMNADMSAQIPIMLRQFSNLPLSLESGLGDWILEKVLPEWARETHEATNECVRALHGIIHGLADARRLAPVPSSAVPGVVGAITGQARSDYVAGIATQLSTYLEPDGANGPYRRIDMDRLRRDHPEWADLVQQTLDRDKSEWGADDVECVAFVDMVFAIAHQFPMAQPFSTGVKGAAEFWNSHHFDDLKGWTTIKNGQGMPQPGDIMVFSGGAFHFTDSNGNVIYPGHVAIVTSVSLHPPSVTFMGSNTHSPDKTKFEPWTFPMTSDGKVSDGWNGGYTIEGFIRQTGS